MNDIVGGLMNGLSFITSMAEHDRKRLKDAEQEAATRLGADYIAATAPRVDAEGRVVPTSLGQMYNTEAGRRLANNPLLQRKAMEGVPEQVKSVEIVRAEDVPTADPRDPRVAFHVVWKDEDGNPVSEGPVTEGRSTAPDAHVVQFSPNDLHSLVLNQVYTHNPTYAQHIHEHSVERAKATLANLFRQTDPKDTTNLNQLMASAAALEMTPTQLAERAGRPTVEQMPAMGQDKITNPIAGTIQYAPSEGARAAGKVGNDYGTTLNIDRAIKQAGPLRAIDTDNTISHAGAITQAAEQNAPTYRKIKADDIASRTGATNYAVRNVTGGNTRDLRAALTDVDSPDPQKQAQGQHTLEQFSAEQVREARGLRAHDLLQGNVDNILKQGTSQIETLIARHAPYLGKDEQSGLYAELAQRVEQNDPRAVPALRTLRRVINPTPSEHPAKLPEFHPELAAKYIKQRLPTEASVEEAPLRMKQRFDYLVQNLPEKYSRPESEASPAELHMAVADAEDLQQNHNQHNADLPMLDRARYRYSYGEEYVGDPQSYMETIYDPLKTQLRTSKVPVDPSRLSALSELVVALRSHGVDGSDAVSEAVRIAADPQYFEHVESFARRLTGHSPETPTNMDEIARVLAKDIDERPRQARRETRQKINQGLKRVVKGVGEGLRGTN